MEKLKMHSPDFTDENIARIAELTAAGRMHPAGLRAFETRDRRNDAVYSYERPPLDQLNSVPQVY